MQTHTGFVKWFSFARGFGFIKPDEGEVDAFVHISAVERAGLERLEQGDRVMPTARIADASSRPEPRGA